MIGLDSYSRQVFIYLDPILIYISLWIDCLFEIRKTAVFPLAFIAWWLQGHWWGFISRNYVVWPTFFLMNVFIALKGSHFWFLFDYIRTHHKGKKLPSVHVLGDFNFKDIVWPDRLSKLGSTLSQSEGQILIDIMNDYGLEQMVHFPTREKNTLDWFSPLYLVSFKMPLTNLVIMTSSQEP